MINLIHRLRWLVGLNTSQYCQEPFDVSRRRLALEVWGARHGQKPRHWSYRVYQAVAPPMQVSKLGDGGFYVPLHLALKFGRRLITPQEAFHLQGCWAPYYAARLCS